VGTKRHSSDKAYVMLKVMPPPAPPPPAACPTLLVHKACIRAIRKGGTGERPAAGRGAEAQRKNVLHIDPGERYRRRTRH